jgi:ADP-heptose:LPS heptosyltransferase
MLGPAESAERGFWESRRLPVIEGLDLVLLAGVLARADVYLGNDSGPTHLAAALGTSGVALFGPTDPDLWGPLSTRLRALRVEPWTGRDEIAPAAVISSISQEVASALHLDKVGGAD